MKIPKQEVKVRIKTESSIIKGTIHIMVDGRLLDYVNSQKINFIPVSDAEVYSLGEKGKELEKNGIKKEIIFGNVEK